MEEEKALEPIFGVASEEPVRELKLSCNQRKEA